jgi:hypothetical protein
MKEKQKNNKEKKVTLLSNHDLQNKSIIVDFWDLNINYKKVQVIYNII